MLLADVLASHLPYQAYGLTPGARGFSATERSGSRAAKPRAPMGSASRAQHMPSQPTSAGGRRPPTVITASFRYLRCSSIPIRYRAAGSFFFWTFSILWSCTCAEGMVTFTAGVYLPCILHCKHKNFSRIHIDQSPWISPLL